MTDAPKPPPGRDRAIKTAIELRLTHRRECNVCKAQFTAPRFVGSLAEAVDIAKCPLCGEMSGPLYGL